MGSGVSNASRTPPKVVNTMAFQAVDGVCRHAPKAQCLCAPAAAQQVAAPLAPAGNSAEADQQMVAKALLGDERFTADDSEAAPMLILLARDQYCGVTNATQTTGECESKCGNMPASLLTLGEYSPPDGYRPPLNTPAGGTFGIANHSSPISTLAVAADPSVITISRALY